MGKNRDRLTIMTDILQAAAISSSKTRLMHEANLSFTLLEKYLHLACKSGLIEYISYKYRLTEQGKDFLRFYKHFEDRYVKAQKLLESLDLEREELTRSFEQKNFALLESLLDRK